MKTILLLCGLMVLTVNLIQAQYIITIQDTTADATAFLTTSAADGCVTINGTFTTGTSSVFSIQGLKVTSGTLTVKIGSTLRIRKM